MIAFLLSFVLAPVPAPTAPPRMDAYGDRLPAGAVARFGTIRWRCPDAPKRLLWSPDGKFLVTTHGNYSITIWAYPSGIVTGRFDAPILLRETRSAFIRAQSDCTITPEQIRFALDSRSMLVYARDNQLFRVHLPDARWERLNTGEHAGDALAISSDGRRVLMETYVTRASSDRWSELSVIDLDRPRQRTVVGTRPIMAPARGWQRLEDFFAPDSHLSADGRFVVMGFLKKENAKDAAVKETGHLAVVDLASGASRVCGGPPVKTLKMAPDGKSFVTLNTDSTLSVWRLGDSPDLTSTPPATRVASRVTSIGSVETFCFTSDGRRLVLLGEQSQTTRATTEWSVSVLDARSLRELRRWTLESSGQPWYTYGQLRSKPQPALAVSPDGRTLAISAPLPSHVRFFDLNSGKEQHAVGGHNEAVTALVSPATGSRLISVSADRIGRVWSLDRVRNPAGTVGRGKKRSASVRESEVLARLEDGDLPKPESSRFKAALDDAARQRMELRKADSDELVRVYEEGSFAAIAEADRPKSLPDAISPSEEWFAYAVQDRVVVRALDSGQVLATFRVPGSTPTAVTSIPGTDLLAAGYHDGQILIWDLLPRNTPRTPPTARDYERLWSDLGRDVGSSTRARAIMLAHPSATVAAIRDLARPFPRPTDFDIDTWIVRLMHPRHIERERAARELSRHFEVAESAMREVLATTRSLEMEERLRRILDRRTDPIADADELRLTRAAAILERIGTPDAKKELFRLARGGGQPADRAADALVRMREKDRTVGPMMAIGGW